MSNSNLKTPNKVPWPECQPELPGDGGDDGGGDDDDYGFPACVKDCSVACLQDGDETCADDCSDDDAATACAMCEGYGFDVRWL